ncbi:MAG: amino acid permease [Candidatus Brocadiales bacterium]|nr:amino acid permease [Candidatus Bathyanammoxibius sp.]
MTGKPSPVEHRISVFKLMMISTAFIISIRNFPIMAEMGLHLVFFTLVAAVLYLIPVALVSAELATGWPQRGGVHVWVREAFGERWGFLAIWLQWVQMLFAGVAILSFIAASLAYVYDPELAKNKVFLCAVILIVYWVLTFANLFGMKVSGLISTVCLICGVFVPSAMLFIFSAIYLIGGNVVQVNMAFTEQNIIPDFTDIRSMALLAGFILGFAGLEVSAVHANEVKNPHRDYPVAMFVTAIIVFCLYILGGMAVAVVIPQKDISLVAGIMETFAIIFKKYHISWLIPFVAILVGFGAIGQASTWIVGPVKGLLVTAESGGLPPLLQRVNKKGIPIALIILQAALVSLFGLVFLFIPGINASYWMVVDLAVMLYLIMYVLMFLAAIRLRFSEPNVHRAYRVPGGKAGMLICAGIGLFTSIFTFIVGFFPPEQLKTGSVFIYDLSLGVGVLAMVAIPMCIYHFRKPGWVAKPHASQ